MSILVESFTLMSYVGLWKPSTLSGWKCSIYNLYTIFVIFLNYGFALSQALQLLFFSSNNIDTIIEDTFILLTIVSVCAKIFGVFGSHEDIKKIRLSFQTDWLKCQTYDEFLIQKDYDHSIRVLFLVCTALYQVTMSTFIIATLFEDRANNELPFRTLLPYDYSTPIIYRITVAMQLLTIYISGNINAAFDTLLPGLMLQICAKINILKCRFQVALKILQEIDDADTCDGNKYKEMEKTLIGNWIQSHNAILSLSNSIESVFSVVMFVQYFISSFMFCATVYLLSQMDFFTVEFVGNLCCLMSLFGQIFMVCFFANQVTFEFAELSQAIYNGDWYVLSIPAKKSIVLMMMRTLKPIVFTSGHIVTLSLESFKALIKISYSIYSVLKSS